MNHFKTTSAEMLARKEDIPHLLPLKEGGEGSPLTFTFLFIFHSSKIIKHPNMFKILSQTSWYHSFVKYHNVERQRSVFCAKTASFLLGKAICGTGKLISEKKRRKKQSAKIVLRSSLLHYNENK